MGHEQSCVFQPNTVPFEINFSVRVEILYCITV